MSYNDERISFSEIEEREMKKIFPIFRMTKTWFIVAGVIFVLSVVVPILYMLIIGALAGGVIGSTAVGIAVLGIVIEVVFLGFMYRAYSNGNMTVLIIVFIIQLAFAIFQRDWATVGFFVWIALSIWMTRKARERAQRAYNDLEAARRYSEERADRARLSNPTSVVEDPANAFGQPIDNSNIFASNTKKTNPDDDIELVSMDSVFAKPKNQEPSIEPTPYTVSPMASFNAVAASDSVEEKPASPFAPLKETAEVKEEAPEPVEGFKGMRYCPKCSFALLPGETKCSRCN